MNALTPADAVRTGTYRPTGPRARRAPRLSSFRSRGPSMQRRRVSMWVATRVFTILPGARELAATPVAGAQEGAGTAERPAVKAGALADGWVLDGRLDDAAWASAPDSIAQLTTIEPREGGVPPGRTVVKVLADRDTIVFG